MPMCPNGHQSEAYDYCGTCGLRITAPSSSYGTRPPSPVSSTSSPSSSAPSSVQPPAPPYGSPQVPGSADPPPGMAAAEQCPQCGTPREGASLFCEECRYNFGTRTVTVDPASGPAGAPAAPEVPPYQRYDSQRSRPSQVNRSAEPVPSGDFLLSPPSSAVRPAVAAPTAGTAASAPPQGAAAPAGPAAPSHASAAPPAAAPGSVPPAQDPAAGAAAFSGRAAVPAQAGPGTAWTAVVAADRAYFTAMMARSGPEAEGLYFPAFSPELEVPLAGNQITIGRRRQSGGRAPDIDLSRAPEDPGVSHQHAVLVQQPDGGWAVVDQGSTNGTTVNLDEEPIRPFTPVPLGEGDRVHVGAWTTITIRRS